MSLSPVQLFVTPWITVYHDSLPFTISLSLLKFMSIESMMPSNHLMLCCSLLLPPSIFPSIRVFSTESVLCIRWPKYWSFSFSISPSTEYSGLISFRIGWFDLLAVQWISRVYSSTTVQKHVPNPGTEPASLTSPVLANRFFITSFTWEVLGILHSPIR